MARSSTLFSGGSQNLAVLRTAAKHWYNPVHWYRLDKGRAWSLILQWGEFMYVTRFSVSPRMLLTAALMGISLLSAAALPAQEPTDLLDQIQRMATVAAQKLESDVRAALREAERLAVSHPDEAVAQLQRALAQVEDSTALSEQRRETLKRLLKDRIRVTAARDAFSGGSQNRPDRTTLETILQLREGIKRWQHDGNRPPTQTAADRINPTATRLAENRQLQNERERRGNDALREVDKTALLPKSDYELPRDWKARTQTRKGSNDLPLTAKERQILQTLDSTISVAFKNSRFQEVIEYLQTVTCLPIIVNKAALEEVGASYDTPITLQVKGVTVRSLLRKILGDVGLTYVIRDQAIQAVTPQQARAMLVVRVYYIGDLLFGGELSRSLQAAQLMSLITSTVDPQSWEVNGGPGKIFYDALRRALVIKQSAEIQPVLAGSLH